MVISEGLPHTLQTWCVCSGRGSDRRGTMFMLCLLSNLVRRLTDASHLQFYRGAQPVCEGKTPQTESVNSSKPIYFPPSCGGPSNTHLRVEIPKFQPDVSLGRTSAQSCKPAASCPPQRSSCACARRSTGETPRRSPRDSLHR